MTDQELFDKVVRHLRTQGRRSVSFSGGCMYRGPDGLKCAIGCLIPEESYETALESMAASTVPVLRAAGISREQAGLARALQMAHDSEELTEKTLKLTLGCIAAARGLDASAAKAVWEQGWEA